MYGKARLFDTIIRGWNAADRSGSFPMADSPLSPLIEEWKAEQKEMRRRLIVRPLEPLPRFVAGADMAYTADKQTALAAAVVYDRIEQRLVEVVHATRPVEF